MSVTHVRQSAVISVKTDAFFATLSKLEFNWWHAVKSHEFINGGENQINTVVKLNFRDNANWTIRVTGISNEAKEIDFEVLASEPAGACASQLHTLKLTPITFSNETLFEWRADYSGDATADVIIDSREKRKECFTHLIGHFGISHAGGFGPVPNPARATMAAHLAAEEAQAGHPHLKHVGAGNPVAAGGAAAQ